MLNPTEILITTKGHYKALSKVQIRPSPTMSILEQRSPSNFFWVGYCTAFNAVYFWQFTTTIIIIPKSFLRLFNLSHIIIRCITAACLCVIINSRLVSALPREVASQAIFQKTIFAKAIFLELFTDGLEFPHLILC